MIDIPEIDFSALDRPEILMFLFHPRPEYGADSKGNTSRDLFIPVEKDVVVGARFHMAGKAAPNMFYFHGNGEIVADYDEIAPLYNSLGVNFIPMDYRGYGRSTGQPTITSMMRDCHVIFHFLKKWLGENDYTGPLIAMGRSLGSASVLELASHYKDDIDGLIVESGFDNFSALLKLLGIDSKDLGFDRGVGFQHKEKIREFDKKTLIIHAENDQLIPFSHGQALYDASRAPDKTLLRIKGANHNDIFVQGFSEYMGAVKGLVEKIAD